MTSTPRPPFRVIAGGHCAGDGRHSVTLYLHDTQEIRHATWTLVELLAHVRRHRPRRASGPGWTLMVGRRRVLFITPTGPGRFTVEHTILGPDGAVTSTAARDGLTLPEVEQVAETFYAGTSDLPCHDSTPS